MKSKIFPNLLVLLTTVLFVSTGATLHAQPAPTGLLREAYFTLAAADHDYKGHRADAMKQIEEAAKLLGVNLHGDDKNHERQGASDAQLRAAQNLLEEAVGGLSGKPRAHVEKAIKQISTALSIK